MQPGVRIGRYEMLSMLGRGGMGEVWKARDVTLDRVVAIKLLPPESAREDVWLARLESEAKLLAALNHPNVAAIHAIDEYDGCPFLVLELVDGVTLADRLRRGKLPVKEALEVAVQIASGLEAAHEQGVVHRDLKPANVCFTPDGRVKVLDFGLAKSLALDRRDGVTRTTHGVPPDATGGTAPYMSPEQARGEPASRQADIWSFGVVLFEMITGSSPFERATTAETIARVLETPPDYASLPPTLPANVRRLLRRCLEKDRRDRLRDMGDVRMELEDALAGSESAVGSAPRSTWRTESRVIVTAVGTTLLAVVGFGVWSVTGPGASPAPAEPVRFFVPAVGMPFVNGGVGARSVAVAKDGSRVAHGFGDQLFVRRLRDAESVAIPATVANPFFSPDGEWVGFLFNGVHKVSSSGGMPVPVASSTDRPLGGDWREDDTIVYATTVGVYVVAASGGTPRLVAKPDPARGELFYAWPQFLPDDRSALITIVPRGPLANAQIARLDLATSEVQAILRGVSGRYVPTGHLVYAVGSTLMAVRFDLASYSTQGEPKALRDVEVATAEDNGASDFAIADNGTLAFIGPRPRPPSSARTLAWVDRRGGEEPLALEPGNYLYARVAPDGTRIAVDVRNSNRDIWVWDIGRETFTRLTDGPTEDMTPVWSPDSRRIFFASDRTGNFDVYSQAADGSAEATVEAVAPTFEAPNSVTPDGSEIVVTHEFHDLAVLDRSENVLRPLFRRDANDWIGEVSRDGRFVAYESDESGVQMEIYVRSYPNVAGLREQVSIDGGRYARWGPPGSNELYYVALDGSMMAVPVELTPTFKVGRATKLFDLSRPQQGITARPYDVSDVDGRFLIIKNYAVPRRDVEVAVVLGWFTELREQLP